MKVFKMTEKARISARTRLAARRLAAGFRTKRTLKEKLFDRLEYVTESGCLLWTGPEHCGGYGVVGHNRKKNMAHRLAWEIEKGPIPAGMCVLHKCDTRRCCNVNHLFIGTKKDNSEDMVSKDRSCRGGRNYKTTLTNEEVIAIYSDRESFSSEIGRKYGVSRQAIHGIRSGRRWGWLTSKLEPGISRADDPTAHRAEALARSPSARTGGHATNGGSVPASTGEADAEYQGMEEMT